MTNTSRRDRVALAVMLASGLVSSTSAARPDDPGSDLFTFNSGDVIETFDSEHFRFHYTQAGEHRVPPGDANDDGVPDHVASLADIYEAALATYSQMGFRAPVSDDTIADNGGDDRFDVYLVDFARNADGAFRAERCDGDICAGYMVQENDFSGYGYPSVAVANRTVASHELFHAVQAAYDADQGAVYSEGTAVWASERFDASLRDLEGFAFGYLENASTPLDSGRGGPVDSFTYGAAIFFEYLSERFSDELVEDIIEATADDVDADAYWFDALATLLEGQGSSFADAFSEFCTWTLLTGSRADADRSFERGAQMVRREPTPKALPVDEDAFIVFSASSRLLSVPLNGRRELHVALRGADASAVRVFVASDAGAELSAIVEADVQDGVDVVDVSGADTGYILVVNTRQSGSSARPHLCVGDGDDVAACAEVAEGEGEGEGDDDAELGGGCAGVPASSASLLALLTLVRRRRSV